MVPCPDRLPDPRTPPVSSAGRATRLAATVVAAALMASFAYSGPSSAQGPVPAGPAKRIVVSLEARTLWLVAARDTLLEAPVAVGRSDAFQHGGRRYVWATPRGTRRVLAKRIDPVWTVPDWHYLERAANEGLDLVHLETGRRYPLRDGSWLEVRDRTVVRGREDQYWTVPLGREIVIDGTLFVPPPGSIQREVREALGSRALDLGDGYLIHGTHRHNEDSIGEAASHGCIRMHNADIERLFELVEPGTPVTIL